MQATITAYRIDVRTEYGKEWYGFVAASTAREARKIARSKSLPGDTIVAVAGPFQKDARVVFAT